MSFPVYIHLGSVQVHPHLFFEALAYLSGLFLYFRNPNKNPHGFKAHQRLWLAGAALAGAAVGSKVLFWLLDPVLSLQNLNNPAYLIGGKTIVGGLIGGLIGVELMKKRLGVTVSTGDAFVPSILLGTAIGRLGCFFTGLEDHTCGNPTTLPWGVDFGDGPRHPTQLYEILWLGVLWALIRRKAGEPRRPGDLFKLFMVGYMGFRFLVEFLKPGVFLLGLTAIQWACLLTLGYYTKDLPFLWKTRKVPAYDR